MDLEHEQRLTSVEGRCKSNTHRIDKLEKDTEVLNRLATSMEVMAERQERVADTVDKLDQKVTDLESKPGKRWDDMVDKVVWLVLSALIGYALAKIGII